ncbi:MAG: M20/M25/M40 family metallo-hydrolase, partial [Methylovirgula sp.]
MAQLDAALAKIDSNLDAALARLFELVKIPSISTDPAYAGEVNRAAEWLANELRGLGFEASVHPTTGHPMVAAKAKRANGPHVLFYGHYDVQPPDPVELWESPPFEPRLLDTPEGKRIVGRGVSDDKGQLMTFIEACRAYQEAGGLPCSVTI